ncbi:MAG TPA: SIS domain-containing protein [Terriglobales bacterium]|nr:SIS domain-containing protein [Terriglobales bacterium]
MKALTYTLGEGRAALNEAVNLLKKAQPIYLVGIGSSYNAGLAVITFFNAAGRPAILFDASELLHFGDVPQNATVVVLSRSGKSSEIVKLLPRLKSRNAKIIALTNTPESPLAQQADVVLKMEAAFDNAVSVSMYSVMALIGGLLACATVSTVDDSLAAQLQNSIAGAGSRIDSWKAQIESSGWLDTQAPMYLLARAASLATANEGELLWEEAAKLPATAMPGGLFRHGPQEVLREGMCVALWIEREKMRAQDLALAADLKKLGIKVLAIGQELPATAGDVVIQLPSTPAGWQFVLDIIPIQIASECLARLGNQNCDGFRLCQYIVENEGGLLGTETKS